jgi:hypothetical protein
MGDRAHCLYIIRSISPVSTDGEAHFLNSSTCMVWHSGAGVGAAAAAIAASDMEAATLKTC